MASKIKFYYDLMSQPSRALYIFLNVAKIPYDGVAVAIRTGNTHKMYAESIEFIKYFIL